VGVSIRSRKEGLGTKGYQRNILAHALSLQPGLRLVIAVDEDVDIYSMDDVMWAIMSRVNPTSDLLFGASGSRGVAAQPGEQTARVETGGFSGGLAHRCYRSIPLKGTLRTGAFFRLTRSI